MEPLLGAVLGGVARLAPEVLKFFDRKGERQHEIKMTEQQLEAIRLQGDIKLDSDRLQADANQMVSGLAAIREAYASQKTGFKFADTVSALVRPTVTYTFMGMYALVKVAAYVQLTSGGVPWDTAVQTLWYTDDMTLFAGILNFWFLGRVFEKRSK